jgi:uncharacterized protein with HEPN domain
MSFQPREYIRHIQVEAAFLISEARNLSQPEFEQSPVLQRAFVRSLEVIGEPPRKCRKSSALPIPTSNGAR